VKIYRHL